MDILELDHLIQVELGFTALALVLLDVSNLWNPLDDLEDLMRTDLSFHDALDVSLNSESSEHRYNECLRNRHNFVDGIHFVGGGVLDLLLYKHACDIVTPDEVAEDEDAEHAEKQSIESVREVRHIMASFCLRVVSLDHVVLLGERDDQL